MNFHISRSNILRDQFIQLYIQSCRRDYPNNVRRKAEVSSFLPVWYEGHDADKAAVFDDGDDNDNNNDDSDDNVGNVDNDIENMVEW